MSKSKIQQTEFGKKGLLPIFPGEDPIKASGSAKSVTIYESEAALQKDYPAGRRQPKQYAEVELHVSFKRIHAVDRTKSSKSNINSTKASNGKPLARESKSTRAKAPAGTKGRKSTSASGNGKAAQAAKPKAKATNGRASASQSKPLSERRGRPKGSTKGSAKAKK